VLNKRVASVVIFMLTLTATMNNNIADHFAERSTTMKRTNHAAENQDFRLTKKSCPMETAPTRRSQRIKRRRKGGDRDDEQPPRKKARHQTKSTIPARGKKRGRVDNATSACSKKARKQPVEEVAEEAVEPPVYDPVEQPLGGPADEMVDEPTPAPVHAPVQAPTPVQAPVQALEQPDRRTLRIDMAPTRTQLM